MASQCVPIPGVCMVCGCTDEMPCYDAATGLTCAWTDDTRTICTRCDELASGMLDAFDAGLLDAGADEEDQLVVPAPEAECDRLIRARRAGAA